MKLLKLFFILIVLLCKFDSNSNNSNSNYTLTDVTSPLTLLAGRGIRLLMFSFVLSTIYELCLLFNESIEDEACSHYKFVVYLTILISFAVLVFTDDVKNTIDSSRGWPLVMLYAALIAEGIFYSPLHSGPEWGGRL